MDKVFFGETGEPTQKQRIIFAPTSVTGSPYFPGEFDMANAGFVLIESMDLPPEEREFEEQKSAFEQIPSLLLEPCRGQFVIAHNGRILDSDTDLTTLTRRFFGQHGDMEVYITRVGMAERESIDTPFFD